MNKFDEEIADLIHQGMTTGKIVTDNLTIDWTVSSCLENCRDYPGVGQIHQVGCPNVPPRE